MELNLNISGATCRLKSYQIYPEQSLLPFDSRRPFFLLPGGKDRNIQFRKKERKNKKYKKKFMISNQIKEFPIF